MLSCLSQVSREARLSPSNRRKMTSFAQRRNRHRTKEDCQAEALFNVGRAATVSKDIQTEKANMERIST